jgi:F-type H+-transporting ATPase subunit gamma
MAQARELKSRMKAVGNIKRITGTMQMIATSKFSKASARATASKPYTEGVFDLVTELSRRAGNISHPLIDGPEQRQPDAKPLVLVISSNRGLCGPYNGSILRVAMNRLRELGEGAYTLEAAGKKGQSVLKFNRFPIDEFHTQFGEQNAYEDVERLANRYMDRFISGEVTSVQLVYMRFHSVSRQRPEVLQLLPLKPPVPDEGEADAAAADEGANIDYEFTPEPATLLADLLPATVRATLFQAFLDAEVSEHIARMVAMKAATDNAGEMGRLLNRKFNRARQAQITTELTEIISGAAALE